MLRNLFSSMDEFLSYFGWLCSTRFLFVFLCSLPLVGLLACSTPAVKSEPLSEVKASTELTSQEVLEEVTGRDASPESQEVPEELETIVEQSPIEQVQEKGLGDSSSGIRKVPLPDKRWKELPKELSIVPLRVDIDRGFCLSHNHQGGGVKGYGSKASLESKKRLYKWGVRWISLTRFGWMKDVKSTEVNGSRYRPMSTEFRLITEDTKQARQLGMKIMIKPHIWVGSNGWRGSIQPEGTDGWKKWFESYTKFIVAYAKLSETLKAEYFVVGVELVSATKQNRDLWLKLIEEVRKVYSGKLVYAANWDEVEQVVFWDKVDILGVQFFGPLTKKIHPTMAELEAGVETHLKKYEAVSKKFKKPIVFTEAGYRATAGSFITPYIWPSQLPPAQRVFDEISQAVGYAAFLNVIHRSPHVKGVYFWKWFSDMGTDEEGKIGFSPFEKLAEKVLEASFAP